MTSAGAGDARPSVLYVATVSVTIRGFLAPFARHLRADGWRVEAAANGTAVLTGMTDAFDRVHELPLSRSVRDPAAILRGYRAIRRVVREADADIVHVHTPIASFITRWVVSRMPAASRPAVIYTAHGFHFRAGGNPIGNTLFRTIERLAGRWTDRLVVINDEDDDAARRYRIVPGDRLVRMPGIGVDTTWYAPSTVSPEAVTAARANLGIPTDAPAFVVIGELSTNKRQADAIDALAAMRHRQARLILLGDGSLRGRLTRRARDRGVAERVLFAGVVEDVRPYILGSTALVINSAREGLARSVMEALALEVPVAASRARGNAELVGDDGFVLPIGDVASLAGVLDWFIEHPTERRLMGQRGRMRMTERYDVGIVMGLHDSLYADVLGVRVARRSSGS